MRREIQDLVDVLNANPQGCNQFGCKKGVRRSGGQLPKRAVQALRNYVKKYPHTPLSSRIARAIKASDSAVSSREHSDAAKRHMAALKEGAIDKLMGAHRELFKYHDRLSKV